MMDKKEIEKIGNTWIKMSESTPDSSAYQENFWAWEKIDELTHEDPDKAWTIINFIRQNTNNENVLHNLAASHLEDLLARHGEYFIDQFESLAETDAKFKWLLGGVWQNKVSHQVWKRLQKIVSV